MIEFRREPAGSPAARSLLTAMEQEMFDLYDMTAMPTPASTAELEPPGGGAYVVGWEDGRAVAGGALKRLEPGVAEIKRMYVVPDARGRGLARGCWRRSRTPRASSATSACGSTPGRASRTPGRSTSRPATADVPDYNDNPYAAYHGEKAL